MSPMESTSPNITKQESFKTQILPVLIFYFKSPKEKFPNLGTQNHKIKWNEKPKMKPTYKTSGNYRDKSLPGNRRFQPCFYERFRTVINRLLNRIFYKASVNNISAIWKYCIALEHRQ
jgi:hypothetical protein